MVGLTKGRFWLVKWIQGGHQTVEGSEILGSKSCERRSFVSDIDPSLRVGPDFSYLAVFELLLPATQKHVYIYIASCISYRLRRSKMIFLFQRRDMLVPCHVVSM